MQGSVQRSVRNQVFGAGVFKDIAVAQKWKEEGNKSFQAKCYKNALKCYDEVCFFHPLSLKPTGCVLWGVRSSGHSLC